MAETPATEVMAQTEEISPTPATPARPGGGRRRRTMVVAAIVAVCLVAAVIAALAAGDGDDTRTSASTTAPPAATTTAEQPTTVSTAAPTTTPVTTPSTTMAPEPGGLPHDPNAYALATFDAWQEGDLATLAELTDPNVNAFLTAASPDGGWDGPSFEGAAGSTYATWTRPDVELVMRVANQYATLGEPHAVHEAYLTAAAGRVAIWPVTTQAEADELQQQVDQGHQPWHLDEAATAAAYSHARFGWQNATVETRSGRYLVTDPGTGAQVAVTLAQPARAGADGIWVVTRASSA